MSYLYTSLPFSFQWKYKRTLEETQSFMWKPEDYPDIPCNQSSCIQEDYVESTPHHRDIICTPCFAILSRFQTLLLRYLTSAEGLHLSSPKGITQTIFRTKHSFTLGKMASLVASSSKMKKGIHLALLKSKPATQHILTQVIHLHEQVLENQQHWTHIVSACRIENLKKNSLFSAHHKELDPSPFEVDQEYSHSFSKSWAWLLLE